MLVDPEVEHHVQAVATAEVRQCLLRRHVRFAEQYRVTDSPLQQFAELLQVLEVNLGLGFAAGRLLEHERHGVHAEAGDAKL